MSLKNYCPIFSSFTFSCILLGRFERGRNILRFYHYPSVQSCVALQSSLSSINCILYNSKIIRMDFELTFNHVIFFIINDED